MKRNILNVCSVVLSLTLFGCPGGSATDGGSNDGGGSNDSGTSTALYTCTRDAARTAANGACLYDDTCACGSHCTVGRCVSDCNADTDCAAGKSCDGWGRCVASSGSSFKIVDTAPQGHLELGALPVMMNSGHSTSAVTITARGVAVPAAHVNVTSDGGVLIRCGAVETFATTCELGALPVGTAKIIDIEVVDTSTSADFTASVVTEQEVLGISVRFDATTTRPMQPLEGRYTGSAHPIGFGSVARSVVSPLSQPLAELTLPIEFTVYPAVGSGPNIVTMKDPLGVLFPDAVTVGELTTLSDGSLKLTHNARAFLGRGTDAGPSNIDVATVAESLSVERGLAGLSITLRSRFTGVLDAANEPFMTWQLTLGRVGDLAADAGSAPALNPAWVVGDPATRAAVPSAAELFITNPATGTLRTSLATVLDGGTDAVLAQAALCTGNGNPTVERLTSSATSASSGDFICTSNGMTGPQLGVTMLKESTFEIADQLTRCLGDLKSAQQVIDGTLMMTPPAIAPCVDGPRLMAALAYAQRTDRSRALGGGTSSDPLASALAHRLLQQWLRINLFVAKQATQVDILNDILANELQLSTPLNQVDMLAITNRGFDLFLSPRVAMGMNRLQPSILLRPDYRPILDPSASIAINPRHEQTTALPVAMVDTLHQMLVVYDALYERARYVQTDRLPLEASARGSLRRSLVLFAIASALTDNARANTATEPTWIAQWNRQAGLYGTGFSGLLRSIDNLRRGDNPLSIDDKLDLPLYRVGDQSGSISKFSAVSDYLLGTGTSMTDSAIVPASLGRAQTALNDARTAYGQNLSRSFLQATVDSNQSARLDALRRKYGEKITSMCGDETINSSNALDAASVIDPDLCFVKPACRPNRTTVRARMAPGDVARVACIAFNVRQKLGPSAIPALANAFTPAQLLPLIDGRAVVKGMTESNGVMSISLSDGSRASTSTALFESSSANGLPDALSADDLQQIQARCAAVADASENARPSTAPSSCVLNGDCPGSFACVNSACTPTSETADQTSCYQGSMGSMAVAVRASLKDIEIARSQVDEFKEHYDIKMTACIAEYEGAKQTFELNKAHAATMSSLASAKLAMDIVSNTAGGVAGCMEAIGSDNKFGICGGIACGAYVVKAVADSVGAGLTFAMDEATRQHELELSAVSDDVSATTCAEEAKQYMVGYRTAVLNAERASLEVAAKLGELESAKVELRRSMREGREAVAAEMDRSVPPISVEYWLSDKVEAYGIAFRASRRVVYLAVLAVEYEYQLSTPERGNVLAATKVSELNDVMSRLRNLVQTGTVRGRSPGELHAVVSLRDNLLRFAAITNQPAGWHNLTEAQRFQLYLSSSRFSVYNADGTWIGQEVPFRVAPITALGLGDNGGVGLLAGQDCAERVWSVNAALSGTDLVVGSATTARVTLKKRNRFFSQWCTPAPTSEQFELNATRPSRNLFLDPFKDWLPGGTGASQMLPGTIDALAEADAFTSARLQPELNVSRADFEKDQYFNGSSRELAGRGLYGDYAIFFPAESLSKSGGAGLQLAHLDDVLLRFDYVSVAQ